MIPKRIRGVRALLLTAALALPLPAAAQGVPTIDLTSIAKIGEVLTEAIGAMRDGGNAIDDMDAGGREDMIRRLSEGEMDLTETITAQTFFDELLALTNEGYFADPIYGGNRDYAGWRMVGFPGAHAYYLDFVETNRPYIVDPRGIAHLPGTGRSASFATTPQEG